MSQYMQRATNVRRSVMAQTAGTLGTGALARAGDTYGRGCLGDHGQGVGAHNEDAHPHQKRERNQGEVEGGTWWDRGHVSKSSGTLKAENKTSSIEGHETNLASCRSCRRGSARRLPSQTQGPRPPACLQQQQQMGKCSSDTPSSTNAMPSHNDTHMSASLTQRDTYTLPSHATVLSL